jgi:hypothetical protein
MRAAYIRSLDTDEEVSQQEDRKREAEGRVEEDQADDRVVDAQGVVDAEDRNHREAGPDPDVGDDHRRRDQRRAEPRNAFERLREGLRADPTW